MNKSVLGSLLIFGLLVTFLSCSNSSDKSRKPVSIIQVSPQKKFYYAGEKVSVKVITKVKNGKISKNSLYLNNQLIKDTDELEFTVNNIELSSVGNFNFKVVATKTDGLDNYKIQPLMVLSDIKPEKYTYQKIKDYPHSTTSYTQGLEYLNGFLYEGTGGEGKSGLYKINIQTGSKLQSHKLENQYFGEGITILNNKIYQITWKNKKGYVYNLADFAVIDSFTYKNEEGWGLTNDGKHLIMSDGSHILTWLDPENFSVVKTVQVVNSIDVVNYLNELEYINGKIFANIYTTDIIVEIDPETGKILKEINLKGLIDMYKSQSDSIDVLNGIAYDAAKNRIFVTGKNWPKLFEVKFVPLK